MIKSFWFEENETVGGESKAQDRYGLITPKRDRCSPQPTSPNPLTIGAYYSTYYQAFLKADARH